MPEVQEETTTDESYLLKEAMKTKRDQLGLSNQAIADAAGLSIHTVNNYFSSRSKATSAYTVCKIAAVLRQSVDSAYGIAPDAENKSTEKSLEDQIAHQEQLIAMQEKQIAELRKDKRAGRFAIYLSVILSIIVAIYFFHFDLPAPDWGFTKIIGQLISKVGAAL